MSDPAIPPCPHRPACPGCPRYGEPGLPEEAGEALARLAARAGLAPPAVHDGATLGFRTRARLAVRGRAHSPKIGIFAAGTHDLVDIPRCRIHHPLVNEIAGALRAVLRETGVEPYAERSGRGALRYVQIALARREPRAPVVRRESRAQVVLVGNAADPAPLEPLFAPLERLLGERLHGLWWNGNPTRGNAILGPHWRHVTGEAELCEPVGGVDVFHPPGAFGQSHAELFEELCVRARAPVPDGARVLELYAGTGAIGLGLLGRAAHVALNELSPHGLRGLELGVAARPAAERARAEILPGDAAVHAARVAGADCVIADPPRRGLAPELVDALVAHPPAHFVYVSCGLRSFLADAARLLDSSRLALRALDAWTLFPYTEHVELLAVFERAVA